ncbi:hypothetical protein [Succinivibrio sp.]|uniref:hypothetical protein n=1 Tax=Succinivibrio sp. TaxID=2053619 RepID=UPI0038635831
MFGFIASTFKGFFSILIMVLFVIADGARDILDDLGDELLGLPGAWIFILFGIIVIFFIKLIR